MKYFTISELCASDTARVKKINNTPTEEIKQHLIQLVDNLLDPLREGWAKYCAEKKLGSGALKVTSGYRCPALNKAVNGSSTSAHLAGYAADIKPLNCQQNAFEKYVSTVFAKTVGLKFDQIIIETNNKGGRWIHFGYKSGQGKQRKQLFHLVAN